ncbi:unnamed protein product [Trifolium pratense]|uniref:Uncharacterized protein n=1 Tax=Trifolium pratense TaxID=57577 RepID=A0ACB0J202_TRIPR|nr:unnamed protein product [Trifolium pratense]
MVFKDLCFEIMVEDTFGCRMVGNKELIVEDTFAVVAFMYLYLFLLSWYVLIHSIFLVWNLLSYCVYYF